MRFSAAVVNAIQALVCLAKEGKPTTAARIASLYKISRAYTYRSLDLLARGGFLTVSRGPQGGFALTRALSEITVAGVVLAVDGQRADSNKDRTPLHAKLRGLHQRCQIAEHGVLGDTTIADLARGL